MIRYNHHMCGRAYSTYTAEELEMRYLNKKRIKIPSFKANYNLAPTQMAPVVLRYDSDVTIELMRWGLVPQWAKSIKDAAKYSLINAKGEEITEKRSYKNAFKHRRCIVPVSGFYEWHREPEGAKRPFAIHLKDEPIISIAGIWEHWKSAETKEDVYSFSLITTAANTFMEKIHNRMPVILNEKDEASWLDPANDNIEALKKLLKPCSSSWLEAYEISPLVNSPRNNSPIVLEPIKS